MRPRILDICAVFKLRIGIAIALSAMAGAYAAGGEPLPTWKMMLLAFLVLAASASAGAFNHLYERDVDARMARTRSRPFVRGTFVAGPAWLGTIIVLLVASVGAAASVFGLAVAMHVLLGALVYAVVYTVWLKRRTSLNIMIGGLSGSFAVLAGAAAVDPAIGAAPLILAGVLFLWTPPHFWSLALWCREDYAAAGVPMLPVVKGESYTVRAILVHVAALSALSLVPVAFGLGWIYLVAAAAGGAYFLRASIRLTRTPSPHTALANFRASLVQLGLLLTGVFVDASFVGTL